MFIYDFYAYKVHLSESRLFIFFVLIKFSSKKKYIVLITSFTIQLLSDSHISGMLVEVPLYFIKKKFLSWCCEEVSLSLVSMCLTLLQKSKIPINKSWLTIQRAMIVKKFLGYFSITFPESSMFALIVIESISKLSFGFTSIRNLNTYFIFQNHILWSMLI